MGQAAGARALQRFFSDYAASLQHGPERVHGLVAHAPRPGFSKATVSAWRASLETRGLGSSSIIIRMSAIRKLAGEAVDNGLLAPELAAGISRVKSVKSVRFVGVRGRSRGRAHLPTCEPRRRCGGYAAAVGTPGIAPHDLRHTCAKLCRAAGGDLEQIQLLLGHASVHTTERYLGTRQDLVHAPNDGIKLRAAV